MIQATAADLRPEQSECKSMGFGAACQWNVDAVALNYSTLLCID